MGKREMGKRKPAIVVYGTPTCPYCILAKQYLEGKKAEFEYVDLSIQKERVFEIIAKSGQTGVPVLDINGRIIIGFDMGAIDAALAER